MPLALILLAVLFRRQARFLLLAVALFALYVIVHFAGTYEAWRAACATAAECPR